MRTFIAASIVIFLAIGTAYAVMKLRAEEPQAEPGYSDFKVTGTGCSCCRGGGAQDAGIEGIKRQAAGYYMSVYKDTDFTVEVKDFGCHQEAYIIKDGNVVKTLSISGGRINEVG